MIQGTLRELCPRLHKSLGRAAAASSSSPAFFIMITTCSSAGGLFCAARTIVKCTIALSRFLRAILAQRKTQEWANPFSFFLEIISLLSLILFKALKELLQQPPSLKRETKARPW